MSELANALGHLGAQVINNLTAHLASEGVGGLVLFGVFVHNMPVDPPTTLKEYWTWVRDSLQTALPVRRP